MKNYLLLLVLGTVTLSHIAYAEIYKRVDADGRVTYSNSKTKGAVRLELDPDANTISNDRPKPSANKRTATPEGFPKVDKQTQNQRDDKRKEILKCELHQQTGALQDPKTAFAYGD